MGYRILPMLALLYLLGTAVHASQQMSFFWRRSSSHYNDRFRRRRNYNMPIKRVEKATTGIVDTRTDTATSDATEGIEALSTKEEETAAKDITVETETTTRGEQKIDILTTTARPNPDEAPIIGDRTEQIQTLHLKMNETERYHINMISTKPEKTYHVRFSFLCSVSLSLNIFLDEQNPYGIELFSRTRGRTSSRCHNSHRSRQTYFNIASPWICDGKFLTLQVIKTSEQIVLENGGNILFSTQLDTRDGNCCIKAHRRRTQVWNYRDRELSLARKDSLEELPAEEPDTPSPQVSGEPNDSFTELDDISNHLGYQPWA